MISNDCAVAGAFSARIMAFAEKEMSCSAHNMSHVARVYDLCMHLAKDEEGVDPEVLEAAVLLHDIARVKEDEDISGNTDHAVLGADMAEKILEDIGFHPGKISKVKQCIIAHRFKSEEEPATIEAKILSDADKLDTLGAIGIARAFMFAGKYNELFYFDGSLEQYIRDNIAGGRAGGRVKDLSKHAANIEFETKLSRIPERLYLQKSRDIAKERLIYMSEFFSKLKNEIKGNL